MLNFAQIAVRDCINTDISVVKHSQLCGC